MVKAKKIKNVQLSLFFDVKSFTVTFSNNLQNLWAKYCSSRTVNINMSRMYYTTINFPT